VHVTLLDLINNSKLEYKDFINAIIDESNSSFNVLDDIMERLEYSTEDELKTRRLFNIVDGKPIKPDKLLFDLKLDYFNQIITDNIKIEIMIFKEFDDDDVTISDSISGEYDEDDEKITNIKISAGSFGELLYTFANVISNKNMPVYGGYDNQRTFDGLCYYDNNYHIMDYMLQLITETF